MSSRKPTGPPPPPVVQRLRIRYAKRGRLRFSSHRDFARAFERALRRADVPMAYSAGFTPHPKISYVGAAPTGVASEAEYLEIGLAQPRDPTAMGAALDAALPDGMDVVEVVEVGAATGESLAARIDASAWEVALPGVDGDDAARAVAAFLAETTVPVQRVTKDGHRELDARAPVISAVVRVAAPVMSAAERVAAPVMSAAERVAVPVMSAAERVAVPVMSAVERVAAGGAERPCAIIDLVVRHVTPAVRPDDVLTGLRSVAGLDLPAPAAVTRLAQGRLDESGALTDPLAVDRAARADGQPVPS
ncbi:MAG: TIGR03936 family radical SAM-associated protein [Frankia sp.]|nr:TIGR03936 family radical SAM-associated protein [Frankia sp.]